VTVFSMSDTTSRTGIASRSSRRPAGCSRSSRSQSDQSSERSSSATPTWLPASAAEGPRPRRVARASGRGCCGRACRRYPRDRWTVLPDVRPSRPRKGDTHRPHRWLRRQMGHPPGTGASDQRRLGRDRCRTGLGGTCHREAQWWRRFNDRRVDGRRGHGWARPPPPATTRGGG